MYQKHHQGCKKTTQGMGQKFVNQISYIIFTQSIYQKELKAEIPINTCTPVFITALFITANRRKQLNVHQQMNG